MRKKYDVKRTFIGRILIITCMFVAKHRTAAEGLWNCTEEVELLLYVAVFLNVELYRGSGTASVCRCFSKSQDTQPVMFTVTDTLALICLLWTRQCSSVLHALTNSHYVTDCSVEVFRIVSITAEMLQPANTLRTLIQSQAILYNSYVLSHKHK